MALAGILWIFALIPKVKIAVLDDFGNGKSHSTSWQASDPVS